MGIFGLQVVRILSTLTIDRLILLIVFNGHGDNWGLCFKHKLLEQTSLVSGVFKMLVDHKMKLL